MNKVNPFPALTAPFPLIFLPNLFAVFNAGFEAILLTDPGKLFLVKVIQRLVCYYFFTQFT